MIKDKIAFWGTDEHDADILVIVHLRLADDIIDIWTLPKGSMTDEFEKKALENIDQIDLTQLPENHTYIERTVMAENLLPDEVKTRNTELVKLAETQWRVRVLSNKLSQKLEKEIEGLVEQVKSLTEYDNEMWQLTKTFWDKVNNYFQEKDLTREHTGLLRDKINEAFDMLKGLRKEANHEAKQAVETINARLQKIIESLSPTQNLNAIFDKLKKLQEEANGLRLANNLREQLRQTFNDAFNLVKEERQKGNLRRLEHRIRGLKDIIFRSEKFIKDDKNDLQFQHNRLKTTDGMLEAQLREAKIKMINTRLESNEAKLKEMQGILADLNKQLLQEQKRLEKASVKEKPKQEPAKATIEIKHKKREKDSVEQEAKGEEGISTTEETPLIVTIPSSEENEETTESTEDHPTENESTPDTITEEDIAAIDPTYELEAAMEEVPIAKDDNPSDSDPTPDAINDENDLTDSAEASSEETETSAEETETSSEETEVSDEDSKLSDEETEASDEEIGTADTGEDMITDNPPSAETQVQVNLPDDFPELIEESDIELVEEEKTVPPVTPEDFTEGEGLYDYDKEEEKD